MRRGIWTSPTEFQQFAAADPARSLSKELATRDRSIDFYGLGMALPNPDEVLKQLGKDITVYKQLLVDGHVRGCVTNRKAGVKKLEWAIDRGKAKSRHAKTLESIYRDLDVDRIMGEMLNASQLGYQPLEVLWSLGGFFAPRDIVGKPQQWFVFNENNELRFLTKQDMINGEALPPRSFLLARNEPTYENPYGFPVLSCCFWPVTFKKGGMKFWVTFTEKFGMPFIVGKHPRGADQTEIDKIADMLERMVQDAIAVIPDDGSVELVENKTTASADIFAGLIRECKDEISTAQLGHTGSSQSTPGKLGDENSAIEVRSDIVGDDKKIIEREFNVLNRWVLELNYAEAISAVPEFILFEEEDVDKALSERDEKLSAALEKSDLRLTRVYFTKSYGLDEEDLEEKPAAPAAEPFNPLEPFKQVKPAEQPAAPERTSSAARMKAAFGKMFDFAAPKKTATADDQQALDSALDNLDPAELQKQMEGVLKPVIELVKKGTEPEDVMKELVTAYPDMDTKALEQMLARAIFVADAWGRLQAEKGR